MYDENEKIKGFGFRGFGGGLYWVWEDERKVIRLVVEQRYGFVIGVYPNKIGLKVVYRTSYIG